MTQAESKFDRLVRVRSDLYRQASVVSAAEDRTLKDFVDEAIRQYLASKQTIVTFLPRTGTEKTGQQ